MSVVRALRLAEGNPLAVPPAMQLSRKGWPRVQGMEPRSLNYVGTACGGDIHDVAGEALVRRVCTDSREVRPGDLFFALKGERFDGHDFVRDVAAKGAVAVVAERAKVNGQPLGCGKILVENTIQALGRLATCFRGEFDLPVMAVGGSNGKTTTKELLASALAEQFGVLASPASFNNHIGVPLTLLELNASHEVAVLEAGTNHPGELAPLVRMIQPCLGVITSIGREHLEFFGDVAGVVQEEGWLAELLPASGKLFVNGDSEWATALARRARAKVLRIGFGADNDWRVSHVTVEQTGTRFAVETSRSEFNGEYELQLLGRHQALNALFALAIAAELGLTAPQCRRGLRQCRPARMRLQVWQHNGAHVLDDSYNANVDSMIAALETLRDFPCSGKRIAVLGDMGELGEYTVEAHAEVGRRAAELGITHLFALGRLAGGTAQAAKAAGVKHVREFTGIDETVADLKKVIEAGDAILVKASRSAGLERLVQGLGVSACPGPEKPQPY